MKNVEQYKEFLFRVQQAKKDEYKDIKTILERFSTLEAQKEALQKERKLRDDQSKTAKDAALEYENHTNTRITILNNEISKTKKGQDDIVQKLAYYKNYEKEAGRQQFNKKKMLSGLIMTVDAIEDACLSRKKKITNLPENLTTS